ncbi:MAG: DNA repair protein RecN [Haliangiales bacterium]
MLRHLRVTNFAILSDVAVDFGDGFNVLTGETGAGKSLIVEAVNLLRGGRASADIPRAGSDQAVVEAIFEVPSDLSARVEALLHEAGLPATPDGDASPDDDGDASVGDDGGDASARASRRKPPRELLVRRVIHRGGRSRTYVNGALTTARRLAELGAWMMDLSGQHQHQGLVDARRHREILDAFADAGREREAMRVAYEAVRAAEAEIEALGGDERARAEKIDYLRFQLDEIEAAAPEAGEDEALAHESARLSSVDKLEAGAREAEAWLCGGDFGDDSFAAGGGAIDCLAKAELALKRLVDLDPTLAELCRELEGARVVSDEAAASIRRYADHLEGDPARLAAVEERRALLGRLTRKHGGSVAALLARADELTDELAALENRDQRLAGLERERARAEAGARAAAAKLTAVRERAAAKLSRAVGGYLGELGMGAARISVHIEPRALGPDGADRVEFVLASNKGEAGKPLARIASGGELSRIMLALKLTLRRADEVATYVFDEVDTGIGGATADALGRQIRALGDQRQILCVTHLPQIVAFADRHLQVSKYERDGRTETAVKALGARERRDELARMLGGVKKSARAHAEAMLEAAAKVRSQPRA